MKLHANARLSPNGRRLLIDRLELDGWDIREAAAAAGISVRTARKWLARWRTEGESGLLDRSSAPKTVANKTDPRTVELIAALRKLRFSGPQIAELTGRPLSTVCAILKRIGMGRLGRLGLEPAVRYERSRPGELIHTDIKKLGRIVGGAGKQVRQTKRQHYNGQFTDAAGVRRQRVGWECVHIAIDDATRLAYAEVLADEKAETAVGFLQRAVEFFARHGIVCQRVITDNGSPTSPALTRSLAASSGCATYAPGPTDPRPTARPNASSAPCSKAGPTAPSTAQAKNAPAPLTAGSSTTTITANTKPSANSHPSTG
jgi:transposase